MYHATRRKQSIPKRICQLCDRIALVTNDLEGATKRDMITILSGVVGEICTCSCLSVTILDNPTYPHIAPAHFSALELPETKICSRVYVPSVRRLAPNSKSYG
jgi:hypothetical protein